jgi:hypothetical protein
MGAGALCCVCAGFPSKTEVPTPLVLVAIIAKLSEVTMKRAAATVVAFDNIVADPRGPKAVCEPIPPNAPAKSAALPLCRSTTITRKKQIIICTIVSNIAICLLSIDERRLFGQIHFQYTKRQRQARGRGS